MDPPPTCRYCLEPSTAADNPLVEPCACRGSQAAVHLDCLRTWIFRDTHHIQRACEVCKAGYSDALLPTFEPDPPTHLGTFLLRQSIVLWLLAQYAVAYAKSAGYTTSWLDLWLVHAVYAALFLGLARVRNGSLYVKLYVRSCLMVPSIHAALLVYIVRSNQPGWSYIVNFWLSAYWIAHEKVLHGVNQRLIGMR